MYDDSTILLNKNNSVAFGFIRLQKGIVPSNFYATWLHCISMGMFLNGIELLQQNVLRSPQFYNLTEGDEAVNANSTIILFDIICRVLVSAKFGMMLDKRGRHFTANLGYIFMSLCFIVLPCASYSSAFSSLFPWYYLGRLLYVLGSMCLVIQPFIADYVEDESKGKAMGLNMLVMAIGFFIAAFLIKTMIEADYGLTTIYFVLGGTICGMGFFYSSLLKRGTDYYRSEGDTNQAPKEEKKGLPLIKEAIAERPWIAAAFIFGVLAGCNMSINTQYMNLYINSFTGYNTEDLVDLALSIGQTASGLGILVVFIVGLVLDFLPTQYICSLTLLGMFGYLWIFKVDGPESGALMIVATTASVSYFLTQLITTYVGFKYYPKKSRGFLLAVSSIFTQLGLVITTVFGGYLSDLIHQDAPFYCLLVFTIGGALIFAHTYFTKISKHAKEAYLSLPKKETLKNPFLDTAPGSGIDTLELGAHQGSI